MKNNHLLFLFISLFLFSCGKKEKQHIIKPNVINQTHSPVKKVVTKDTNLNKESKAPVLGIDVSHFQGNINWEEVKKSGVQFCYAKATQGTSFKDPNFQENKQNANKADLPHGAYHFYMSNEDPEKQANLFLSCIGQKMNKSMLPMLDLEQGGIQGKVNTKELQQNILVWLDTVEKKLGVKPVIYTNNPFAKRYLQSSIFAEYKLWLAEYGVNKPRVPSPWKNWTIWQRSEKGFVSGAKGNIDHDILNAKTELKELIFDIE